MSKSNRIVDADGQHIDDLKGLSLTDAESVLCRLPDYDVGAYYL